MSQLSNYSLIITEFQKRLNCFSDFWDYWKKNIRSDYLRGEERGHYDELTFKYEKDHNVVLTFESPGQKRRQTCFGHGEFVISMFLESMGICFETEITKEDLVTEDTNFDYDIYTMVSPFDIYICELNLLIEMDGVGYHIFSICTSPTLCTSTETEKEKRRPPRENVNKHIDKYYGKDNLAKGLKIDLIRIISNDILTVINKKQVIKIGSLYLFALQILPFIEKSKIDKKEEIIKKIEEIKERYYREFGKFTKEGNIKFFNPSMKFGFINSSEPGIEYYFVFNSLKFGDTLLKEGLQVKFNLGNNYKGVCADNIHTK